jgi:hypothetical protein
MWSVVCVGMVQARWTELPIRTAERFKTGVGRLRLGGWGAAGAPQPIVEPAGKIASRTAIARLLMRGAKTRDLRFMLSQRKSFFVCRTFWRKLLPTGPYDDRRTPRRPASSSGYSKLNPKALNRAGKTRSLTRRVASAISPKASRNANAGTGNSVGR